jgi:hypothetical protein
VNYIHQLQDQVSDQAADLREADAVAQELTIYLNSPKFHDHDEVNRKDVLAYLERLRFHLSYASVPEVTR